MKSLLNNINTLSDKEIHSILEKDFTSEELIEILNELFLLDPKESTEFELFDCCGTGGDKSNTFNISTTTAIIAASTGIKICKNGGRSSSSKTGSVDVLEELGVNFSQDLKTKLIGLKKYGLTFHSSKAIAERLAVLKNYARKNKISSFLSLLGPFTNPFFLKGQIIGVGKKEWFETMTELARHSIKNKYCKNIALVQSVNSKGQVYDELTSINKAKIRIINQSHEFDFDFKPQDFGLKTAKDEQLIGGESHKENAHILSEIVANRANNCQIETVLINLALLLCLDKKNLDQSNIREHFQDSFQKAKLSLEGGKSLDNWLSFLEFNQADN